MGEEKASEIETKYMAPIFSRDSRLSSLQMKQGPILSSSAIDETCVEELLGILEEIRAEAQNLRESAQEVLEKGKTADPAKLDAEVQAAQAKADPIFRSNKTQIDTLLKAAADALARCPAVRADAGDEVKDVENAWERATLAWPTVVGAAGPILQGFEKVDGHLRQVVYHCSIVTIPVRANRHLRSVRVGRFLNFEKTFKDEVPDKDDLVAILDYLHDHPKDVHGLVDLANGVIYPYERKWWRRALSNLWLVLAALGGFGVVYVFANLGGWGNLAGWPVTPDRLGELLTAYMFILVGGVAHVAVDALKKARAAKGEEAVALDDIGLWINIKRVSIWTGIATLVIGLLGLAFTMNPIGWDLAFFVGYTIDSVADTFLARFETKVTQEAEKIKPLVAGTTP